MRAIVDVTVELQPDGISVIKVESKDDVIVRVRHLRRVDGQETVHACEVILPDDRTFPALLP